jgi:DNA-binding MarR family transcriptional regulator
MAEDLVLVDYPLPHVKRVTLNRPEKRNALFHPLRGAIMDALRAGDMDNDTKVMIVRGNGPSFSAGYDLGGGNEGLEYPHYTAPGEGQWPRHVTDTWMSIIWDMSKSVIAQVHGYCLAGAAEPRRAQWPAQPGATSGADQRGFRSLANCVEHRAGNSLLSFVNPLHKRGRRSRDGMTRGNQVRFPGRGEREIGEEPFRRESFDGLRSRAQVNHDGYGNGGGHHFLAATSEVHRDPLLVPVDERRRQGTGQQATEGIFGRANHGRQRTFGHDSLPRYVGGTNVPNLGAANKNGRVVTSVDHLLTWMLSQAAARSHRILQRRLESIGFTGYEYRILASLADGEPLNQTELGKRAALDRSDVTTSVRQLHSRGLLDRRPDPDHGRRVIIKMTTTGRKAWIGLERLMTAVQDEIFEPLTNSEQKKLRTLLTRVAPDASRPRTP